MPSCSVTSGAQKLVSSGTFWYAHAGRVSVSQAVPTYSQVLPWSADRRICGAPLPFLRSPVEKTYHASSVTTSSGSCTPTSPVTARADAAGEGGPLDEHPVTPPAARQARTVRVTAARAPAIGRAGPVLIATRGS